MSKYFKAVYSNGYCGCDEAQYLVADSEDQAYSYMEAGLQDYADQWTHVAFGWDTEYTDEEYEDYFCDCGIELIEVNESDLDTFEEEEGIDHAEWNYI